MRGNQEAAQRQQHGQAYVDEQHDFEKLAKMRNDWERYTYCRQRAEQLMHKFFDAERNYVASVLASDSERYTGISRSARVTQAQIAFETGTKAQNLAAAEKVWHRWAQGYLAAWQAKTLHNLVKAIKELTAASE